MTDELIDNDLRFAGAIGEDYEATFKLVCPHLEDLEHSVAKALLPLVERNAKSQLIKILDIGCGDGITAKAILNTLENIELTILDNEQQMIDQARKNLKVFSSSLVVVQDDALSFHQVALIYCHE
jgi:methylase of polypeptide subunit release factors